MSTANLIPAGAHDVRLAPDRLYWSVLDLPQDGPDAPTLTAAGPQALFPFLEDQLLPPLGSLYWAAAPAGPRRIIVCLAPVAEVAAARRQRALFMGPAELPTTIHPAETVDPRTLNLLSGKFEPLPTTQARSRFQALAALLFIFTAALLLIGLERRSSSLSVNAQARLTRLSATLALAKAPTIDALLARQKSLQVTRYRLEEPTTPAASTALASLLAAWPSGTAAPLVQVDSLNLGAESISLQLRAHTREDATSLARSLGALPGWSLTQPQLSISADTAAQFPIRASFHLQRTRASSPASPPEARP